jgi:short-subunit dehydrogenase
VNGTNEYQLAQAPPTRRSHGGHHRRRLGHGPRARAAPLAPRLPRRDRRRQRGDARRDREPRRRPRARAAAEVAEWAPAPIGAVFNNAGVALAQTVAEAAPEDDEWLIAINFDGVVHGVRAFLPILLRQDSGTIVNTSSVFGLAGIPTQSAYCASKFAVRGFTESLRHELRGTGVRATTVHPGGIKTNIVRNGRMYADARGLNRTAAEMSAEFDKLTRTSPERAAAIIHKGVDAGKARILIGADAYLFDALTRITPTHYYGVLDRIMNVAAR